MSCLERFRVPLPAPVLTHRLACLALMLLTGAAAGALAKWAVCARILEDAAGRRLWMSRDTLRLFEAPYPEYLTAAEDFLAQAGPGELCFVEEPPLLPWLDRLEGLVLYRWNRRYPADAWLDVRPGPPGWTLARREEFSGHSHERITKEVYTR